MANYDTGDLIKAQAMMTQDFNSGELRFRDPVTFKSILKQTEIMIPSHKVLRTSDKRPDSEVNYFVRSSRSLGTGGRTHNHTGVRGDSAVLTPSFTSYGDKYVWYLKQGDLSVFPIERQLANELGQVIKNFAEGLETVATNYVFNNRSGVNGAGGEGIFNTDSDVYEITEDLEKRSIQITKTVMQILKYSGMFTFYCSSQAFDKFEYWANQGGQNAENTSFQFNGIEFIKSLELDALFSAAGYDDGGWIAVQQNLTAVLDWIPIQNRQGVNTKVNRYFTLIDPDTGLMYGGHEYMDRADGSSVNSDVQDVKNEVEFTIDLSFQKAPLSTANETPLQAFAFVPSVVG